MNDQEKRFVVIKIEKYEREIEEENRIINKKSVGLVITSILAIEFLARAQVYNSTDITLLTESILGGSGIVASLSLLKSMISSISRKTILESKVEDLKEEISFYDLDNEESRGAR